MGVELKQGGSENLIYDERGSGNLMSEIEFPEGGGSEIQFPMCCGCCCGCRRGVVFVVCFCGLFCGAFCGVFLWCVLRCVWAKMHQKLRTPNRAEFPASKWVWTVVVFTVFSPLGFLESLEPFWSTGLLVSFLVYYRLWVSFLVWSTGLSTSRGCLAQARALMSMKSWYLWGGDPLDEQARTHAHAHTHTINNDNNNETMRNETETN